MRAVCALRCRSLAAGVPDRMPGRHDEAVAGEPRDHEDVQVRRPRPGVLSWRTAVPAAPRAAGMTAAIRAAVLNSSVRMPCPASWRALRWAAGNTTTWPWLAGCCPEGGDGEDAARPAG